MVQGLRVIQTLWRGAVSKDVSDEGPASPRRGSRVARRSGGRAFYPCDAPLVVYGSVGESLHRTEQLPHHSRERIKPAAKCANRCGGALNCRGRLMHRVPQHLNGRGQCFVPFCQPFDSFVDRHLEALSIQYSVYRRPSRFGIPGRCGGFDPPRKEHSCCFECMVRSRTELLNQIFNDGAMQSQPSKASPAKRAPLRATNRRSQSE